MAQWIAAITRDTTDVPCSKDGEIIFAIEEERLPDKSMTVALLRGVAQHTDKLDYLVILRYTILAETGPKG